MLGSDASEAFLSHLRDCEEYFNDEGYEYDETRREINKANSTIIKIRKVKNKIKTRPENNRTFESKRTNRTKFTKIPINGTTLDRRTLTLNNKTELFKSNKTVFNETLRDSRRYGICQNDHGGPLVTWVGAHEVLIGVASVFRVAEDYKCIGPFLYTSTQCNGAFLDCILTQSSFDTEMWERARISDNSHRRSFCRKSEDDEKHATIERHISWISHPAGPADHEKQEKKEPVAKNRGQNEDTVKHSGIGKLANTESRPYETFASNKKSSVNVNNEQSNFKTNDDQNARGPVLANKKYTPNNAPVSNNGPDQVMLKRFEQSYKPKSTFAHAHVDEKVPKETAQIIETALYGRPASSNRAESNNNKMPASNIMPASNNNNVPTSNIMPASNNNGMPPSNIMPASNNNNMPSSNNRPEPKNMQEALRLMEIIQNDGAKFLLRPQAPLHN